MVLEHEMPSFISSFSPEVLCFPDLEKAVFTFGEEPKTLWFSSCSTPVPQPPPNRRFMPSFPGVDGAA